MTTFEVPSGDSRIRVVASFAALLATPLRDGIQAVCWRRELAGDFAGLVRRVPAGDDITTIDDARLDSLADGGAVSQAIAVVRQDLRLLREAGFAPQLDRVNGYARDDDGPVPTDVYSFHVDSANAPTDTFLCTYAGAPSEGLRDDEAQRCIDVPELREALRRRFGGEEGPAFAAWLHEHCYDRHYRPLAGARPYSFGVGNLWRLAVQHPEAAVTPCIHRAPAWQPGQPPRLLLIS